MPRSRTQHHSDLGPPGPRASPLAPAGADPTCPASWHKLRRPGGRRLAIACQKLDRSFPSATLGVEANCARGRVRRRGGRGLRLLGLIDFCAIGLNCADSSNRIADCCCYWWPKVGSGGIHASHSEIHRRGRRGCAGSRLAAVASKKADACANRDLRRLAPRSLWRADRCEACRAKSLIAARGFAISAA
jgi:hypothetical protein